jgi:hypothetical protein
MKNKKYCLIQQYFYIEKYILITVAHKAKNHKVSLFEMKHFLGDKSKGNNNNFQFNE